MHLPSPGQARLAGPLAAYNEEMLHALQQMLAPAVMERLTLIANHVLSSESGATARLLPHAGKSVALELPGWPSLLPPVPPLAWRITPAGLLGWCGLELAQKSREPAEQSVEHFNPVGRTEADAACPHREMGVPGES